MNKSEMHHQLPLGVAVVGAGYWGPNLVRNFAAHPATTLLRVCDLDRDRAERVAGPGVAVTDDLNEILDDPAVGAVAIATPASTHVDVALACLEAGKHVVVEKPLALSVADGDKLVAAAADRQLTLMCDHTYCYTPAVRKLRDLLDDGTIGDVQYFDSVRINLGLVQSDIDVFWDLGPHDLSILDFVLPEGVVPVSVAAQSADPIGAGQACIGYLTLELSSGAIAHIHLNWLSPTKIRTTIVGGTRRIAVWDDLNPAQRLSLYDKGVELGIGGSGASGAEQERRDKLISYRVGDMVAPALRETEALAGMVTEFVSAIRDRRRPLTDGGAGVRVLRVLEAIPRSIAAKGASVPIG
jgi:predicted dehydrogenase